MVTKYHTFTTIHDLYPLIFQPRNIQLKVKKVIQEDRSSLEDVNESNQKSWQSAIDSIYRAGAGLMSSTISMCLGYENFK